MKRLYLGIITILLLINYACSKRIMANTQSLKSVKFFAKLEFYRPEMNTVVPIVNQTVIIMYYGDYHLLVLPILNTITKIHNNQNNKQVINTLGTTINYAYFIYKTGEKTGLRYDSISAASPAQQDVNEVINNYTFKKFPFYLPDDDVLVHKVTDKATGDIIETHTYKRKVDDTYFDTIYYYFNRKYQQLNYAIAPALDSSRKMKMYKAVYHFNALKNPKTGVIIPERNHTFKIEPDNEIGYKKVYPFIQKAIPQLKHINE